jgi:Protein of unknown function (DUF3617)
MRQVAIMIPVLVLAACGPSEAPLFNRQAGMWKVDMQMLTSASSIVPAEVRASMSPEEFAQMQVRMSQLQEVEAPRCVDASETYAHNLTQYANGFGSLQGCDWERNEVTGSSYSRKGLCPIDGEMIPVEFEGSYSDTVITTTFAVTPPTEPNKPPPGQIRIKMIETRTGDCA